MCHYLPKGNFDETEITEKKIFWDQVYTLKLSKNMIIYRMWFKKSTTNTKKNSIQVREKKIKSKDFSEYMMKTKSKQPSTKLTTDRRIGQKYLLQYRNF